MTRRLALRKSPRLRLLGWVLIGAAALAPLQSARAQQNTSLPATVRVALERADLPPDALVAWVQEAGSARAPRMVWQPDQPVNPASVMKLVTTYAALDLLGPAWTWNTPVWLQGPVNDGVLEGNLAIKGSGDPKLVLERVWLMLKRVRQLGVREIRGDIVLDRSAFAVPDQNPADFDGEPLRPYNVGPDALLLNYKAVSLTFTPMPARGVAAVSSDPPLAGVRVDTNVPLTTGATASTCGDWRGALGGQFNDASRMRFTGSFSAACGEKTWSIAYVEPKSYNERVLAGMWSELGGTLGGKVREGMAPANVPPTFVSTSPTLAEVVRDINKFSNNVMAQQLYLTLGSTQRGQGTPDNARAVLRQWAVDKLHVNAAELVMDSGSGLSRDSRVSARLLARLLQSAWSSPVMPELMSSLPVSGVDGTARRSGAPSGRAHLKTGSLRDVRGVAGYVLGDSGRRYVVVAIINHDNASTDAARAPIDALLQWTAADTFVRPDVGRTN